MKIGAAAMTKLAEMICGDEPFSFFPYRSSSYLTRFFVDLDLDYSHNGSTRRVWVREVLGELNNRQSTENMPSKDLVKVIEYLVHPDHFLFNEHVDRAKSLEAITAVLKTNELALSIQPNGTVKVSPLNGEFISTSYDELPSERIITFKPSVFQVPEKKLNENLISVMMPFNPGFNGTYSAITRVAQYMSLECLRADDIWDNSTFIQDIFDLIFCSKVVVVDFTGKNPNVMYETGIAHTLGKTVIPITQSLHDIPSDLGHHRALTYYPNEEGLNNLSDELYKRLKVIYKQN
ncbi:hypothetical protein CXF78_05145 [Shewanella sp. 11B5]|jgi:hypothetical protein|uniref:hypothetical protein n=1 Tax=unclassified Shewanella TaxID=196818 RepID=UPI000C7CDA1D|nr:hypothetical protein [Shewanella sp. 11B5]PKI07501.1 hypothetical protein CXF78_05145 [Shewanella sp. 11B5]